MLMNGFPDTQTCGSCCRPDGVVLVNGPTASACSAEPWEPAFDGCGTRRTTSGPKCTRSTRGDGCMLMLVREPGTSHGYTQKVL